jgi:hypothetical protein
VVTGPLVDFLPQFADEDVHRPVTAGLAATPDPLEQLVTADDPTTLERQGVEQPKLGRRQPRVLAVNVGLNLIGIDP